MSRTTVGLFFATALIWLASAIPVALVGGLVGAIFGADGAGAVVALAVWTVSGVVAFLRPVELWLARRLFRARVPTEFELRRLEPAWERVCAAAGEDPADYILRIEDRDEINATAAGARIVSVTTMAMGLHVDQLCAVLAHELGHHLDEHPIPTLLSWWFALPSVAFDVILRFAGFLAPVLFIARIVLLLPRVLARLASAVLNRAAEFEADRHAARLGFGPRLAEVFEGFLAAGHGEEGAEDDGPARIWATHPPLRKRIAALRAAPPAALAPPVAV